MIFKILFVLFVQVIYMNQLIAAPTSLTSSKWKSLPLNSFGCRQGKVADVILFLDTSQHLSDQQFENQIQRAEHIVRLFRNFKTSEKNRFNRIAIVTISDETVKHVVRLKKPVKSAKHSQTDELVHILRKLRKTPKTEEKETEPPTNRDEMLALKQLKRLSSQMRKSVAHLAFYFSADETVSKTDLRRAKFIRRLGIYLYILRLGPSQITYEQFKKMVHQPVSAFVFPVKAFSNIDASIKKLLDMEHCDMQISPESEESPKICSAKRPVNLIVGIDPITLDRGKTRKIQHFVLDLRKELQQTNGDKILVEEVYNDFNLKPSGDSFYPFVIPDYNDLLKKINETALSLSKKGRKSAQNTLLLFLDSDSNETKEMIKSARYLKNHKMEIYAIVIEGKGDNFSEMVSQPTKDHLLQVENEESLNKEQILTSICKGW